MYKLSGKLLIIVLVIFGMSSANAETKAEKFVKNVIKDGANNAGNLDYLCERVYNLLTFNTISKAVAGDKHQDEYRKNKSLFQSIFAAKLVLEANKRILLKLSVNQTRAESSNGKVTVVSVRLSNDTTIKYKLYQVGKSFRVIDFFTRGRWLVDYYKIMLSGFPKGELIAMTKNLAEGNTCHSP